MNRSEILGAVGRYYTAKLESHGPTARGVDWNSPESQRLRFEQLSRLLPRGNRFSVIDYGCGYGALADYLGSEGADCAYQGFDISPAMIEAARALYGGRPGVTFGADESLLEPADYAVASGIFNVRLDVDAEAWTAYVMETLDRMDVLSRRGFAFNALTCHSDPERMRADLYYADPLRLLEACRTRYSRFLALLHDYPLYEFTLLVRKPE